MYESRGKSLADYFPYEISSAIKKGRITERTDINEIRLRTGRPVIIRGINGTELLSSEGRTTDNSDEAIVCTAEDIMYCLSEVCDNSLYSYENELNEGFVTVSGGHRIGICGTAVTEAGSIKSVKDITSMNFRISREIFGCSEDVFRKTMSSGLAGILVSGPPGSGKTTFLRDLCRNISQKYTVSVIDERCEIAAAENGNIYCDTGMMSDVYSAYPKSKAIENAVRTMSPDVILCDEIGNEDDLNAIVRFLNTGVKIIASVHAENMSDLYERKEIFELIKRGTFKYIVCLGRNNHDAEIYSPEYFSDKGILL